MSRWNETLNLTDVWDDGKWTDENIQELGKILAARLRRLKSYDEEDYFGIVELADNFDNILTIQEWKDDEFLDYSPLDDFNYRMADLYDWCDGVMVCVYGVNK